MKGRAPVIAGTGSNCTRTAVELSVEAQEAGADGVLLVSPYYNKATQKGLKAHFTAVAEAIKIPAILYNIPSRTGVNIAPETIAELCRDVKNIVGVKEASGDFGAIATLLNLSDGNVDVYSGNDDQVVPMLALGAKGVISVLSNVAPRETHDMCAEFFKGNVEASRAIQLKAMPLIKALFCEVNPIPVKAAMNLMGKDVLDIHIYSDRSNIELFSNGYQNNISCNVFTPYEDGENSVFAEGGDAVIQQIQTWDLERVIR